ncbi:apolipoprotein N-acyltransferase [Kordiimonas sp. SCSIO 12603]|uniref:apolipoprotein N-acyltransferase n=1 Tax=Kordiimonas sp. SCSIO 12603 TaxID=2829596 RepID=UPI002104BE49|nr:apolipoprotein N-acyltransferase [Kordiimonas sp. SCSIO 12603]UTW58637.1 apolipoprotein N-acyltransferase [Kordiimonas sp. SCSIO 12603]
MATKSQQSQPQGYAARLLNFLDGQGRFRIALIAFLGGALLAQAFAPRNFFPALFIVFPLFVLLVDRARTGGEAFGRGWWAGFGFLSIGLNWISHSFTQQDNVPAILGPFAVFGLSALMAIYIGLTFWLSWRINTRGIGRVVLFAASWTLFEGARGMLFTGFPWHLVGSAWSEWLSVAQAVHYTGVYGLSFITVLAAGSLALLVTGGSLKKNAFVVLPLLLVLPVMSFTGKSRLDANETRYHLGVTLRLVQANVSQRDKWRSYLINDHFDNHMQLSRGNDADGKARDVKLLIWPETAVQRETFDREGSLQRWRMSRLLEYGNFAVTGVPRFERRDNRIHYFNSLVAVNSEGDIYARYDKNHLVPFGEYVPFASLFEAVGLGQLTGGVPFSSGAELQTINLPGVPSFSPLICYEAIFPGRVVRNDERPEWMLNISNDAWFGLTSGPYQHLALARLRAIEEGMPIVRSTSTGISAVLDSFGRTVGAMGLNKRGVLDLPLPVALEAPAVETIVRVYAVLTLCLGLVIGFAVVSYVGSRRK